MIHYIPTQDPKYDIANEEDMYQAVQLCNSSTKILIPPDEPIFILRAKDVHAVSTLYDYKRRCLNYEHSQAVLNRIQDFLVWQNKYAIRVREPDTKLQK